jgi:hypothetical protein
MCLQRQPTNTERVRRRIDNMYTMVQNRNALWYTDETSSELGVSVIFPVQDSWVKLNSRCIVYVLDAFCLLVLTRIYICCIFFAKHTFQGM